MNADLPIGILIGAVVGIAAGVFIGFMIASAKRSAERANAEADHARAVAEIQAGHTNELSQMREYASRLQGELETSKRSEEERQAAWEEARQQLQSEFAQLAWEAIGKNSEQFLSLADTKFKAAEQAVTQSTTSEMEKRHQAIGELVAPLSEQLKKYEEVLHKIEQDRVGAYSKIYEQVQAIQESIRQSNESQENLRKETRNLVTALRQPSTRGRWGEQQLRRVVEMAGMVEHCDFDQQVTVEGGEGRLRPDVIVHIPGGKNIVVDAKVPLDALLYAMEAEDDDSRRSHLEGHARQMRSHVDKLAAKAYWEQFDNSPDFVVAFIPGDSLLATAFEQDPDIFEYAINKSVLLATPTTLIALLKAVAFGWQQESLAEGAREVRQIGREMYKRLITFATHMSHTGRSLSTAVDAYNKAVGSLERSVLPQARRFEDLGVITQSDNSLPALDQLDIAARSLQAPEVSEVSEVEKASEAIEPDMPTI